MAIDLYVLSTVKKLRSEESFRLGTHVAEAPGACVPNG